MIIVLLLGLLMLGVAVMLAARALAAPRARAVARLSEIDSYGFAADAGVPQAAAVDEKPDALSNLMGSIGAVVTRRFARISESGLRSELMAAGLYTTSPRTLLGYRVVAAVALGALMSLFAAAGSHKTLYAFAAILSVGAGWMLPLTIVRRRARFRLDLIERELPDLIDLLVVTIEAGLGISASLRLAASELEGPLGDELRLTLQEQTMGLSVSASLSNLLRRSDTPGLRSFVRAVVQGESLGVSTGSIMRNLAREVRKRRRQTAQERAQQAPIKILFPLVFFIFPTIFIILFVPALSSFKHAF